MKGEKIATAKSGKKRRNKIAGIEIFGIKNCGN
jgi:hypothetical protein